MAQEEILIDPIEAMRLGVEYRFPVRIRQFTAHLRPLSISETLHVTNRVTERLMDMDEIARNRISEHALLAQETLILAAKDLDNPTRVQPINEMMIGKLTNAELEFLFKQYVSVVDKTNPALEQLSVEEIQELVSSIKKKETQPIDLSFLELVNIVRSLLINEDSPLAK